MPTEITRHEALDMLERTDVRNYRIPIEYLKKGSGRHLNVFVLTSDSRETLAVCRQFPKTALEVYLVGEDPDEITDVLQALPDGDKDLYVTTRENKALSRLARELGYEPEDTNHDFHCTRRTLISMRSNLEADVIRLNDSHKSMLRPMDVAADGDVYKDWIFQQWDIYFDVGHPVFGIVESGRVVAFCSVADDGEISFVYTIPEYRRQGLGQRVLAVTTRFATTNDRIAYYNAHADNKASIATALSVGYVEHTIHYSYSFSE